VLLMLDEVMCGMGRTGSLFACLDDGVEPDILVAGKGLAAGYVPVSAMLVTRRIHDAIKSGSGSLRNGQTFVNHPLACATALEVQKTIAEEHLVDNVRDRGQQFRALLSEAFAEHPHVGDIRGRGLFTGVELVDDRPTKRPFPARRRLHAAIKTAAWRRGLMIYPMGGTIDGTLGDHVLFAPPFISTKHDIETITETFADVVKDVFDRSVP